MKHYPFSSPQLDFWFDQVLHPNVPLYNIGGYVRIAGPVNPTLFEQALNRVVAENDALRIILHEGEEGLPTQTFAEEMAVELDFRDFSERGNGHEGDHDLAHVSALAWMEREFVEPFPLYERSSFGFALCKVADDCYYWLKKYHHIIVDGWAISLIVQRVAAVYNALTAGESLEVGALPRQFPSYLAFIDNDKTYLDSEKFTRARDYWRDKYRELPEPLLTPHHTAKFQGRTIPSRRATLRLARDFHDRLAEFAQRHRVSVLHVILGALYCYFTRADRRQDLVVGLPTLGRNNAAFKQTVGLFAGISPAWFRFGADLDFVALMEV